MLFAGKALHSDFFATLRRFFIRVHSARSEVLTFNQKIRMKKKWIPFIACIVVLQACGPKILTSISKSYPVLDYREEVRFFGLNDPLPASVEKIGVVKIGDSGFTTDCQFASVVDKAKLEARKVGGNAIKIIEHKLPGMDGSSCHRIQAAILRIENFDQTATAAQAPVDSTLLNADYALLHIYRNASHYGSLISYNLYLGDSIICRVSNRSRTTIRTKKDGLNTLWAKTEAKVELPINIKLGQEYYIRCGIAPGLLTGRPSLEIADSYSGKLEYDALAKKDKKKAKKSDVIVLNDSREIVCEITGEDDENIYLKIMHRNREIESHIPKSQVQSIRKEK